MTEGPALPVVVVAAVQPGVADERRAHWLWCPGCSDVHRVIVGGPDGWSWNSSLEAPGYEPSILVRGGSQGTVCHSFLRDGVWEYLPDSTHRRAGRTAPVEPVPEWLLSLDTGL